MNHSAAITFIRERNLEEFVAYEFRQNEIERFIRQIFAERFCAHPDTLLPNLVATSDRFGAIDAAAGFRGGESGPLFLENYLNAPVERIIAEQYGEVVPRSRIAEVGNLATKGGRAAVALIANIIPYLMERGFEWVVFTGNDAVRNLFQRLHLFPFALCHADAARLGSAASFWGSYYEHHPIVMTGRLRDGAATIALPSPGRKLLDD